MTDDSDSCNDALDAFFSEIDALSRNSKDTDILKLGPKDIVLRLVSQHFASPYQVLQLKHDADEEEIKKRYRKLSLIIHPDKFKHEKAQEAFNVLKNAFTDIQNVETRKKYQHVYGQAKKAIYKRHGLKPEATYLELVACGVLDDDLERMNSEIISECERMLQEQQERREYAEKCLRANIEYEKRVIAEKNNEEKEKLYERIEWENNRDERTENWKVFNEKVNKREIKLCASKIVDPKREERSETVVDVFKGNSIVASQTSRQNKRMKLLQAQESYKSSWR